MNTVLPEGMLSCPLKVDTVFALAREPSGDNVLPSAPALECRTEQKVRTASESARAGRTVNVAAHCPSTVRNADRISVINQSRSVESGTQEELLSRGRLCADLYESQSFAHPVIAL